MPRWNPGGEAAVEQIRAGEAAMHAGIRRAAENANPEWVEYMLRVVEGTARALPEFTADDIFGRATEQPEQTEKRALGAVMKQAAANGWCVSTEQVRKSKRPNLHRSYMTVWRSKIYAARTDERDCGGTPQKGHAQPGCAG